MTGRDIHAGERFAILVVSGLLILTALDNSWTMLTVSAVTLLAAVVVFLFARRRNAAGG